MNSIFYEFITIHCVTLAISFNASIWAKNSSSEKWRIVTACWGQLALQIPQPLQEAMMVPAFFPFSVSSTRMALKGQRDSQSPHPRQRAGSTSEIVGRTVTYPL